MSIYISLLYNLHIYLYTPIYISHITYMLIEIKNKIEMTCLNYEVLTSFFEVDGLRGK